VTEPVTLAPESVRAVAHAVVKLLADTPPAGRLVDAATLAGILGVERSWVYDNAERLAAVRIGDGDRPRLRFNVERALTAWSQHEPAPKPTTAKPRPRAPRDTTALLPIRGREATS